MPRKGGGRDGHGTGQQTSTRKAKNAGRNKRGDAERAEAAASALRAATKDAEAGAGAGAGAGGEADVSVISEEAFLDAFDQLSSKRGAFRDAALEKIIRFIQDNVSSELITARRETLRDAALGGLRKNRGSEAKLSSRLVSLLALQVGPGNDEVAKTVNDALKLALEKKALGSEAHAAVVTAIGISTLVCATEDGITEDALAVCEGLCTALATPAPVRAAALQSWALLASVFNASEMKQPAARVLAPFSAHVQHPDVDVRTAAGVCLALIDEVQSGRNEAGDDDEGEEAGDEAKADADEVSFDEDEDVAGFEESDGEGSDTDHDEDAVEDRKKEWNWAETLGGVWQEGGFAEEGAARQAYHHEQLREATLETIATLRNEGGKRLNRKDKRALRSTFRDVHGTIAGGLVPVSTIRIREAAAELYGWGKRIQLAMFRDLLGPGLQHHLEFSDLLHAILDVSGSVSRGHKSRKAKLEKRALMYANESNDRARTHDRQSGRNNKAAANQAFMASGAVEEAVAPAADA